MRRAAAGRAPMSFETQFARPWERHARIWRTHPERSL